ncbi:D-alanine--D-alanine ligase [Cystobacter fuscus]|uniref:D-alanine--D-alanine ligase n=1 Tax=Cystobacter fuscus TaxID=43 RepID=A0A250JBF6_9BACT|nr:ATP-grasp domain-containing protein [Cystobacter fuscus]ATB40908.1 D-alanine--D-alanine ligase [Cystobacter fuscus]
MPASTPEFPPVAILYQAVPAPEIDGIRKPMKPGGYSDSGADIGHALRTAGVPLITPRLEPDPTQAMDWVFPDTAEGIAEALRRGARVLWANTVLFAGHPLDAVAGRGVRVVGQHPARVDRYDDKWLTQRELREAGCPVPASTLIGLTEESGALAVGALSEQRLQERGLGFPLVIKPVRGRGSEGVGVVRSLAELERSAAGLLAARDPALGISRYGQRLILERFLPGTEVTLTVMPPGSYLIEGTERTFASHWALPAVRRFNHHDGIAPYSGMVAVVENSVLLSEREQGEPAMQRLSAWCALAASKVQALAPIRIDCRSAEDGEFLLFDLNMKPNMTGPGRPGREAQDSLCSLAARGVGWSYQEFLLNMLRQAWSP